MSKRQAIEERVAQHYSQHDLEKRILDALAAAGKDVDRLAPQDLAPVDEFHTGGRGATAELAAQLEFSRDMDILDVGCGIGGASRFFAERYGCRVTGIDITDDFVDTAEALSRRVGLQERVSYRRASALDLPFSAGTFDGAYMMHVGMNVADKQALFAEIRRVLKAGAAFGVYEVAVTGAGEVSYPIPCALTAETSFMASAEEYRTALGAAGFEVLQERDRLEVTREFFRQEMARAAEGGGPPPLGVHILLKQEAQRILPNTVRLFEEGVVAPVEFVCRAR